MAAEPDGALLDPRLRFPIHALPNERVVWAGTAVAKSYGALLLRSAWQAALGLMFFVVLLSMPALIELTNDECRITVDPDAKPAVYRPCTSAEAEAERAKARRWLMRVAAGGGSLVLAVVVLQAFANALGRRNLVYVATNERVVVQDGALRLRIDTIDLDHVVSVTAEADLIDRWFGLKSISVIVPGQRYSYWHKAPLANAVSMWGIDAHDPALSQLLNVWLPRQRH